MINNVTLVGRLTKDPILRKTQSGASVVSFTVACGRRVGQGQEPQTDFINCIAWNRTADVVSKYTHKGSLVGIEGRIQTRNYDNEKGERVYVTEVVCESVQFLESKKEAQQAEPSYEPTFETSPTLNITSDDLPF